MKKTLSAILLLLLILSLNTAATATKIEANNGTASTDIKAVYAPGTAGTVVSVEISWENMEFTYNGVSIPKWNADTHSYSGTATEAGWSASNAKINITNHSNVIIQSDISYTAGAGFPDSSMLFSVGHPYVGSAYTSDEGEGTACAVSIKAIPDGIIPESTTQQTSIGSITVTVNALTDPGCAQDAIDALNELYRTVSSVGSDPSAMVRGTVYFPSGESANAVRGVLTGVSDLIASDAAEPQINLALNEAITALYGALEIKQ